MLVSHDASGPDAGQLPAIIETRDPGIEDLSVRVGGGPEPFHLMADNLFLLQTSGAQKAWVWDPSDREVVSERCLELFHTTGSRELLVFREQFRPRAMVCELKTGVGVYIPALAPYLLEGGGAAVALTYSTRATRESKVLYKGNHALRELGLAPHPIGVSGVRGRLRDRVKLQVAKLIAR